MSRSGIDVSCRTAWLTIGAFEMEELEALDFPLEADLAPAGAASR
jgi:hypothetical protein